MNKKHFIEFAKEINNRVQEANRPKGLDHELLARAKAVAMTVCKVSAKFNPSFDEKRFLKACGLES